MRKPLSSYLRNLKNNYISAVQIKHWALFTFALVLTFSSSAQITGPSSVCVSATITLSVTPTGGTWSSSAPAVATVGSSSGIVTGVSAGTATINYVVGLVGSSMAITVNPLPAISTVTGGGSYCAGLSGLHVGLTGSSTGVNYQLYNGPTAIGAPLAGTGGALDFGLQATAGTYTVIATNATTGCTRTMAGSAIITINPLPSAISGPTAFCSGATGTLSSSPLGGVWSSGATAVATIGSSSGILTAVAIGTSVITYTLPATGCATTKTVTVTTAPGPITAPSPVCAGNTDTLTDGTPGGVWSSGATSIATIGSLSGILTGVTSGTVTIVYSLGTLGCTVTTTVAVTPGPSSITGAATACVGSTVSLSDATLGGAWSSSNTTIATVSGSGVVTGADPGTVVITYLVGGCSTTLTMTVNSSPAVIGGPSIVCIGNTITLTDAVPGGNWSTISGAVTVGSSSGVVTGVSSGTASINYSIGGCFTTTIVTVVPVPAVIVGPSHVCVGTTIALTDVTPGGSWTSSNPADATIGIGSGIVTGVSSGTVIISYTTGCSAVVPIIVDPISPILGTPVVCVGQTTHLTDATLGGTWSSFSPGIATVSGAGVVTGVSAGSVTIDYTMPTGCHTLIVVTVNPQPLPISGPSTVCIGDSISLSDASPGGTWSSSNPVIGSVDPSGDVTGISIGTTTISYTYSGTTGCLVTKTITVNSSPGAISGPGNVCLGSTITLTDAGTGTWSSSNPATGSISPLGVVYGVALGSVTITYTLGTGCVATTPVTVINMPLAIAGPDSLCAGGSALYTDPSGAGIWSSSNVLIASVGSSTGVVNGVTSGIANITFTSSPGCYTDRTITINVLPGVISGTTNICPGSTTTLTDAIGGGTWTSSNPAVATIGSTSGVVAGIASGITIITYTLVTGCSTTVLFTVNTGPLPISGYNDICIGSSAAFADPTPSGTWSSSAPTIAPVDAFGVVSGLAVGTAVITYSTGTPCPVTMPVTVTPLPAAISGSSNVCAGSSTTLTEAVAGGTWSSSNIAVATVGTGSGIVTGVSAAPVTIIYTIGPACIATKAMTVNPLPMPITGSNTVCQFQSTMLSDATPGGAWSSSNPTTGSIDVFGNVTGISPGTTTISYSTSLGCSVIFPVTVNIAPTAIIGSSIACLSNVSILHDAVTGGTWSSLTPVVATIGSSSGIVTGVTLGTDTIIYMLPSNGCFVSTVVTVYPLPAVFSVTGGGPRCSGDTGTHIGLSGSAVGCNYLLYLGSTAVGTFAGTGGPLDFGLLTLAGTYTATSTNTATGCTANMAGTAVITITPSVVPSVGISISPNDTVCAGAAVTFTPVPVHGGTAPTYRWSVNSFPVSLGSTYVYIPADSDIVEVTMTSNATCPMPDSVRDSVMMTVLPFKHPSVSIAANPGDTVCQGTHVTLNPIPLYGGPSPTYDWFKNSAPMGSSASFSFVPADGDMVYCVLNSDYLCLLSGVDTSAPVTMTVDTPVIPTVFIAAYPSSTVIQGQNDTLVANVSHATAPTYQWYLNNVLIVADTTNTYINNYSSIVNDSVTCMVTTNGVCRITTFQYIRINVVTGIDQLTADDNIILSPNPNKGEFIIKGTLGSLTDEDVNIEIADMLGRVVYKNKVTAKYGKLNEEIRTGNLLTNGMYLLSLHSGMVNKVFHIVIEQ